MGRPTKVEGNPDHPAEPRSGRRACRPKPRSSRTSTTPIVQQVHRPISVEIRSLRSTIVVGAMQKRHRPPFARSSRARACAFLTGPRELAFAGIAQIKAGIRKSSQQGALARRQYRPRWVGTPAARRASLVLWRSAFDFRYELAQADIVYCRSTSRLSHAGDPGRGRATRTSLRRDDAAPRRATRRGLNRRLRGRMLEPSPRRERCSGSSPTAASVLRELAAVHEARLAIQPRSPRR